MSESRAVPRRREWLEKLIRLLRLRMVIPLLRAKNPPAYIARGVAVGLAWALTPLVGVQIPLVVLCWLVVRKFFVRWDFHLGVAMAWTLLTNVFTLPFFYYGFLVTGRIILGRWDRIGDFGSFYENLNQQLPVGGGWLESMVYYLLSMFIEFGWPMFIGSVPWAIVGSWLGYRWSLRLVVLFRQRRLAKNTKRLE